MKRKIFTLLLVLILAVSLSACGGGDDKPASSMLSVNVGPEPESIDPAFNVSVDVATLLIHGFEGLMKLDENGVPQPGMAGSYEISDDLLTYTFNIRDGAMWNDGEPLTAEQFVYAWKRAADPSTGAPYGYLFDVVKGYADVMEGNADALWVKALDERTLEVALSAPCPYFLELCAFPTFSPVREDAVLSGESWAAEPGTYVSNGPYSLEEWVHDSYMVYAKNEYYYDADAIGPDNIRFVLMEDDAAALAAFQNGEISFTDTLPAEEVEAWQGKPEYGAMPTIGTFFISFQTQKEPFDDPMVRKALSLAIDRNYICEQISKAGEQPAGAYVPAGLTDSDINVQFREAGGDYYSVEPSRYEANCDEARELLALAGYPAGSGFPKLEYIFNESTLHLQIGEALQSMWKEELGIEAAVSQQEWGTFIGSLMAGNYDLARNGWNADYNDPISFLDMWVSGGGNNVAGWSNAEYDELIYEIKSTVDSKTRFAKMHEAETLLMDQMPIIPIYFSADVFLIDPELEGFYCSPLGFKYFMNVSMPE